MTVDQGARPPIERAIPGWVRFAGSPWGLALAGLLGGIAAALLGAGTVATLAWATTAALGLASALAGAARQLARREFGVDIVAILAIAGALVLHEYFAGAVIACMLLTGSALEAMAMARAERALTALVARSPRLAHRLTDSEVIDVPVDEVRVGDRLVVKEADIVPVDGLLSSEAATLDESTLTGESHPVEHERGDRLHSGAVNASHPFEMRATAAASESTYAGMLRLVEEARRQKAPFTRMADRYASLFVPFTLVVAALAWLISGDPARALAVLVVATPCPLLLAAPIAFVAGISSAARRGILVRGGVALEALSNATSLFLDKTGTLTAGSPYLTAVITARDDDANLLLARAASLDQMSSHVLAEAVVHAARDRELTLELPTAVSETPGGGIAGLVAGHEVLLGHLRWLDTRLSTPVDPGVLDRVQRHDGVHVAVAIDGIVAGALLFADPIRLDARRTVREMKHLGFSPITMLTGDRRAAAEAVGDMIGIDHVVAQVSPEGKVKAVAAANHGHVAMVGDGINDAPALAQAAVGIAMGARGATGTSEAADIVLLVDRLDRLPTAARIARRTCRIARESVLLGMGLSIVAMGVAAIGLLPPAAGALLQEGIDVGAILWALRALSMPPAGRHSDLGSEVAAELRREHAVIDADIDQLARIADTLDAEDARSARTHLVRAQTLLREVLLPHERADEAEVYPMLRSHLRGDDLLASLSRAHQELFLYARRFDAAVSAIADGGPASDERHELRRLLYGLHALLRLHNNEEEELYHWLSQDSA